MQEQAPAALQEFYNEDYYNGSAAYSYKDERRYERYDAIVHRARLKNIARFVQAPAELLDIGCAFGSFVKTAQDFGYKAHGLDISPYAVEHAQKEGLAVLQGDLAEGEGTIFPEQSMDIVTLIEVIEHIPNPAGLASKLSRILRPKGLLVIQTANFLGWQARLKGAAYHYYLPGHLFYYSTKSLRLLLEPFGFGDFRFYRGVDFPLLAKLRKARGYLGRPWRPLPYLSMAAYHFASRIAYADFALTSSMVLYAFRKASFKRQPQN